MFGIHDLSLFIVSGLLLNIMPGPDSLLIMTRSATQGWRAGVVTALGIGAGPLGDVLAGARGFWALVGTAAAAVKVGQWVGAAYIVWCGIGMLRARLKAEPTPAAIAGVTPLGEKAPQYARIFGQGFLTNVLNPKVALFFLAFVPQFIDADAPSKALAFIILGCIFNFNGMLWCNGLAVFTAFASARLTVKPRVALWLNRVTGSLFLLLGARLALADRT
jgi:threonine/homoserine/homoserine lactone efflux protein